MNDVTVEAVEQGLLNNIQVVLNQGDSDGLYMEELSMAVGAYGRFLDAQMMKAQTKTMNP